MRQSTALTLTMPALALATRATFERLAHAASTLPSLDARGAAPPGGVGEVRALANAFETASTHLRDSAALAVAATGLTQQTFGSVTMGVIPVEHVGPILKAAVASLHALSPPSWHRLHSRGGVKLPPQSGPVGAADLVRLGETMHAVFAFKEQANALAAAADQLQASAAVGVNLLNPSDLDAVTPAAIAGILRDVEKRGADLAARAVES